MILIQKNKEYIPNYYKAISMKYNEFINFVTNFHPCRLDLKGRYTFSNGVPQTTWISYFKVKNFYHVTVMTVGSLDYMYITLYSFTLPHEPEYIDAKIVILFKDQSYIENDNYLIHFPNNIYYDEQSGQHNMISHGYIHLMPRYLELENNDIRYFYSFKYFDIYNHSESPKKLNITNELVHDLVIKLAEQIDIKAAINLLKTFI